MARRHFDRFMVDTEIGLALKLSGLTDGEWRAHVGGVLAIAAKSPIRGRLLIGDMRAEHEHVAHQAGVKPAAARSAMEKLRAVGILIYDDEFDCERVHDFEDYNPPPKKDDTAAERQRRRRERLRRERDASNVTPLSRRDGSPVTPASRSSHADEVEGGSRTRRSKGSNPPVGLALRGTGMSNVARKASR